MIPSERTIPSPTLTFVAICSLWIVNRGYIARMRSVSADTAAEISLAACNQKQFRQFQDSFITHIPERRHSSAAPL